MPRLSKLGEFKLIESIRRQVSSSRDVLRGIGDDAALVRVTPGRKLLLTTDMLLEGVHFLKDTPPEDIGRKAMGCNVSDIAAMGGMPKFALVSLGVDPRCESRFVRELYAGMEKSARQFGVSIVGGDTVKSEKLIVNIAMCAVANLGRVVLRSGAKPGDQIFVTGPLGRSFPTGHHLKFTPRLKESQYLIKHAPPSSMIDVSDGLAADLGHILKASKVGAVLWEEAIPRRDGAKLNEALYDGEDFELLFTVSAHAAKKISTQRAFKFYPIGEIVREGLKLRNKEGKVVKIEAKGYRHF